MRLNLVDISYSLSIRLLPDGFSIAVYDSELNEITSLTQQYGAADDMNQIKQTFAAAKEILPDYQDVALICETPYYTLVPKDFFTPESALSYLQLQHPTLEHDFQYKLHQNFHIEHFLLENHESVLIFAFQHHFLETIKAVFPGLKLKHQIAVWIEQQTHHNEFAVWIRGNSMDCLVFQQAQIQLLNSYSYQTSEDILYHMLSIMDNLKIDHTQFKLTVFSSQETQTLEVLQTYLPQIVFNLF